MAMLPGEKVNTAQQFCAMKLHRGGGRAWVPQVPPQQTKNSRSWTLYLDRCPRSYSLPLKNTELVTVRLHLTAADVSVWTQENSCIYQWFSAVIDAVTCAACHDDWYLEYQVAGKTWATIAEAFRHADQEKATDGPSSYPGHSRVAGVFGSAHFKTNTEKSDYEHVAILTCIGFARGMVRKMGFLGESEPIEPDEIVITPNEEDAYPAYPARIYDGKLPELRPTVSIIPHSLDRRDFDITRFGGTFEEPDKPDPDSLGAVRLGPLLVEPAVALKDCKENTIAGVHRHWRELPLEWMTPQAHTIHEELNSIFMLYMGYVAMDDPGIHMSSIKLPLKWSAKLQEQMWEHVEQDAPQLYSLLQKLREIGLPMEKLPRLILNMGTRAAASNALFCCPTESVMHHGFPQLTLKHMSIDEQDQRIVEFQTNVSKPIVLLGQRIYKTIISTDNSAMDSTVCIHDRSRYVNAVRSLLGKLREGCRRMRDPIGGLGSIDATRKFYIQNKFIDLSMQAIDMGVGSGERITSGVNRHTKILNQGFEMVKMLGPELGVLLYRLWLLYEPADEDTKLTETEIKRIQNGAYIRHHDSAFDLGIGDGDDNVSVFCTLEPLMPTLASEKIVSIHRQCYKILEPAFNMEFQNAVEVLSRVHIPKYDIHFPLPKKWLQKVLLCHLNCDYDATSQHVRLGGSDYAQIATALLQRVYAARQLPVLRWLGLALAEMYTDYARTKNWHSSVYTDDDRRRGLEDGDFVLRVQCDDMRGILYSAVIDYDAVVEVLADGAVFPDGLGHDLGMADYDWSQMYVHREMIYHRTLFETAYPLSRDIRTLLGITEWTDPCTPDKLVNSSGAGPVPLEGNAVSLHPLPRTCGQKLPDGRQDAGVAVGTAKPLECLGRALQTATGVESAPAGTSHDSAVSLHRGDCVKTTVVATVSGSIPGGGGPSGATVVCGGGTPGPVIEPQEAQPQAQKVLLSKLLPESPAADSRVCQAPTTIPLVRTSAVGGITDMLQESPQLPVEGATLDASSKTVSCERFVEPGSNRDLWHDAVIAHLTKHGQKNAAELIDEGVLPVIKKDGTVAVGKRRKFANQTLADMAKLGLIANHTPGPSQMPKWFAVTMPPGI